MPNAQKSTRSAKISILELEGIIKKISYERRDYESVDEESLSLAMSRKTTKKKYSIIYKGCNMNADFVAEKVEIYNYLEKN